MIQRSATRKAYGKFLFLRTSRILKYEKVTLMKARHLITEILLVIAAGLAGHAATAQTEEALLQELSKTQSATESSVNGVILQQNGVNNEEYIHQVTNVSASGIQAVQKGNENTIQLMQTGDYINIRVMQNGDGNSYEADLEGQDAKIDISQSGSENMIYQSLIVNSSDISIIQRGARNEVIHTGTSNNSGIQVQQQGAGMKVIIQTN